MKTISRFLAGAAVAASLALAPAAAFAETSSAKPPCHDGRNCTCRHDAEKDPRASATNPEDSYDAPAWVRYMWSSP